MTLRRLAYYIAVPMLTVGVCAAPAAAQSRVSTENFVVEAANRELAERFAREAEKFRREKAEQWLGYEMPTWPQKCPLKVKVTMGQTGGATTFTFGSDGQRSIVRRRRCKSSAAWNNSSTAFSPTKSPTRCSPTTSASRSRAGPTRAVAFPPKTTTNDSTTTSAAGRFSTRAGASRCGCCSP